MALNCCVCGSKLGLRKVMIKNRDYLCYDCVKAAGFNPLTWTGNLKTGKDEIQGLIAAGGKAPVKSYGSDAIENRIVSSRDLKITRSVGNLFKIDEEKRLWYGQDQFGLKQSAIHSFDDILDYELLEDGNTITKGGLGSAVVGGAAFGAVGALVGASVGKRTSSLNCTSMRIKITLNSMDTPVEYIDLLQMKVSKSSAAYKKATEQAQEILALLQVMTHTKEASGAGGTESAADEIMKYKRLLDAGAITAEEFEAKKRQLLGL